MSSGSYFPPPVRAVPIPKRDRSGERVLGVPTVADRIAQTVVADYLMRRVEPIFHPDSYGYRPGRGALDAVGVCRQRCWRYDWVIDLDVQAFFDSPHDLLLRAVAMHTDTTWVLLDVRRITRVALQQFPLVAACPRCRRGAITCLSSYTGSSVPAGHAGVCGPMIAAGARTRNSHRKVRMHSGDKIQDSGDLTFGRHARPWDAQRTTFVVCVRPPERRRLRSTLPAGSPDRDERPT